MDTLYTEINEYLKVYLSNNDLKKETIIPLINNYGDYIKKLVSSNIPKKLYKYINIPLMINDLYEDGHIFVFCFNPYDDNESLYSVSEYDQPEHTEGFINSVKLLDDSDIREQITANYYTGGFWDEKIHWVIEINNLVN